MTRIDRDVPVENLVSVNAFTDYLRNNLAKNVKDFVKERVSNTIDTSTNRDTILRGVVDFQSDLIHHKIEDDSHMRLDQNVPVVRPQ